MAADPTSGRVLVYAPRGRNADLLVTVLGRAGVPAERHGDIRELCGELSERTGAAVLSEEALDRKSLEHLVAAVNRQPPWSEIPLLILTGGGTTTRGSLLVAQALGPRGNFTLLERPVRILTLVTAVRAALRARQRQYEVKALLASEQAAREDAERASKLKDEFLATLSHELRTPLSAILGWSQLLQRKHTDPATLAEGVSVIARNARAQTQLIEDLLDMSRIASGKIRLSPARLDLRETVASAIDSVRVAAAAKEVEIESDIRDPVGAVSGDGTRLQQVFWNLLVNATKFTPAGGKIQVLIRRVKSDVEVEVSDTGQGIPPDFLPHVFGRFRQADGATTRRHGGLGIGLALVKQLVELHGGRVRAASGGEGRGATFTVSLPAAIDDALDVVREERPLREGLDGRPVDLRGVRVLVVDDEPDALDLARRVLQDYGAVVTTADTASAALDVLSRDRPDVLLSDIGMPEMDGYELIRRIRSLPSEAGGQTPAAALTAFARGEDREKALLSGFQSHVTKPVDAANLARVVASLARAAK